MEKQPGDEVVAASINKFGGFTFQATKVGEDTILAQIIRLVSPKIASAIRLSHRTLCKIRQGLFWAFFYNVLTLPLAIFGIFTPVIGGGAGIAPPLC